MNVLNLNNWTRRTFVASSLLLATMLGGVATATAQYYDDGYNQQGYDQQGYGQQGYDNYGNMDVNNFYDELAPYGDWIQDPQYGSVWAPRNVGRDFQPYYTNGYWAMTEYGNTWVSNYNWGWAAFHYGRWSFNNAYGWVWVPGSEWGPAWVNWRQSDGYYGWAPLSPGISLSVSLGGYNAPIDWWIFVPQVNIYSRSGYNRYNNRSRNYNYYNRSTMISNRQNYGGRNYVGGPNRNDIERVTRKPVQVLGVNRSNTRGNDRVNNGNVVMYNPSNNRSNTNNNVVPGRQQNNNNRGNNVNSGRTNPNIQNGNTRQPVPATPNNNRQVAPGRVQNTQPVQATPRNDRQIAPGRVQNTQPVQATPNNNRQVAPGRVQNTQPVQSTPRNDRQVAPTRVQNSGNTRSYVPPTNNNVRQQRTEVSAPARNVQTNVSENRSQSSRPQVSPDNSRNASQVSDNKSSRFGGR